MTTIATDGKSMAGDGLCTGNGMIHSMSTRKVHWTEDGCIVGISGSSYAVETFLAWNPKEDVLCDVPEDFEALVLHPDGTCRSYNNKGMGMDQELPAVSGSGGAIALGAMLAGATPEEAVRIACQRDICTGGIVTVEHLKGVIRRAA